MLSNTNRCSAVDPLRVASPFVRRALVFLRSMAGSLPGHVLFVSWLAAVGFLIAPDAVRAHQTSQSWLALSPSPGGDGRVDLQWDIALRDLDMVLDLDRNRDGALTGGEVDAGFAAIESLARSNLGLSSDGQTCRWLGTSHQVAMRDGIAQARLNAALDCGRPVDALTIDYRLFGDYDASHRALLTVGDQQRLLVPGAPAERVQTTIESETTAAIAESLGGFVRSGIHHILVGWDHLAFLVALMVPVWLVPGRSATGGQSRRRSTRARALLLTITAFTVAHSITLAMAATGWVVLPAGPIEALIAASIAIAALANLLRHGRWQGPGMAFAFGLLHGFGFANVMQIGDAQGSALLVGLFGFNLGVEIGQILFVVATLPLFWLLAHHPSVQRHAATTLSLVLVALGSGWFAERAFDLVLLPG